MNGRLLIQANTIPGRTGIASLQGELQGNEAGNPSNEATEPVYDYALTYSLTDGRVTNAGQGKNSGQTQI